MANQSPPKSDKAKWVTLGVVVVLFMILSFYASHSTCCRPSERTRAVHNAKNIQVALFMYAGDHDGTYPSEKTAGEAESGDTAAACFNQLINLGVVSDERVFWSKKNSVSHTVPKEKPNDDGILTAGENAWGYVRGLTTSSPAETPIIFDSSVSVGEFNTLVWDGKAIVVRLDGSVTAMEVTPTSDTSGRIYEEVNGKKKLLFEELPEGAKVLVPRMP